jgi:hypothetical protein
VLSAQLGYAQQFFATIGHGFGDQYGSFGKYGPSNESFTARQTGDVVALVWISWINDSMHGVQKPAKMARPAVLRAGVAMHGFARNHMDSVRRRQQQYDYRNRNPGWQLQTDGDRHFQLRLNNAVSRDDTYSGRTVVSDLGSPQETCVSPLMMQVLKSRTIGHWPSL